MQVWWDRGIPLFLHTLCTYSQLLQRERLINGHNGVHYWQSNSLYFTTQYKEPSFSFKTVTVWVFCFQGLEQYKVSSLLGYSGGPGVPSAWDWFHSDQFFCNPTFFPFPRTHPSVVLSFLARFCLTQKEPLVICPCSEPLFSAQHQKAFVPWTLDNTSVGGNG